MEQVFNFAQQNWLIAPAALAAGEAPPPNISRQRWRLTLTGVVIPDFQGNSPSQWRHETLSFNPKLESSLSYAVNTYAVPRPPGEPHEYEMSFQVDLWTLYAAPSSMLNLGQSINSGFAVDNWRIVPFGTATDAISNNTVNELFRGAEVDVAVRDNDATLHRISYHINLLGRIIFTRPAPF